MKKKMRIGTRGSKLALWQANWVKNRLENIHSDLSVELLIIKTKGDKILDVPLAKVGGKGLFVKEIEEALLDGRIDLAVHSMKDMPGEIPEGLCIGAIPEREDPRDVLIARNGTKLTGLRQGAAIGTSSLRRSAQLKRFRPDLSIASIRGNLDTRLRKLESENLDAVVLAAAGVIRMGFDDRITEYLDQDIMLPAAGQGALCIETRQSDPEIEHRIAPLHHEKTGIVVIGERAFLGRMEAGCQAPIAVHGTLDGDRISYTGFISDLEGKTVFRDTMAGPASESEKIGLALAETLIDAGAQQILDMLKACDEK